MTPTSDRSVFASHLTVSLVPLGVDLLYSNGEYTIIELAIP